MYIYTSTKILAYVYQGTHKVTGQIYIGSRIANKVPAHLDLPNYKTSAPKIKESFLEFEWVILAEFFNKQDAYNHEQLLIWEQWRISKDQSLNKACYHLKKAFNRIGCIHTEESKSKLKLKRLNQIISHTEETKAKIKESNKESWGNIELRNKLSVILTGKIRTEESRRNMSIALKGLKKPERTEEHKELIRQNNIKNSAKFDFCTPEGFIVEQISTKDFCSTFGLYYSSARRNFKQGKSFKGFSRF